MCPLDLNIRLNFNLSKGAYYQLPYSYLKNTENYFLGLKVDFCKAMEKLENFLDNKSFFFLHILVCSCFDTHS